MPGRRSWLEIIDVGCIRLRDQSGGLIRAGVFLTMPSSAANPRLAQQD